MKTAVMTDTNSGIMKAEADSMGIFLIPMPVIIDDETHYEGIDLTEDSFYGSLTGGQNVSTSQPSPGDLMDLWDDILEQGYDEIIHIPMSSGLSASCSTAISLSDDYDGKVQVADNHRISVTQERILSSMPRSLQKPEKQQKRSKKYQRPKAYNSSIYIASTLLEFLKKGGRVTAAGAALGSVLNIKPILTIQGGKLDAFAKTRGMKKCKQKMVEALKNDRETRFKDADDKHLLVGAAGSNLTEEEAAEWKQMLVEAFPNSYVYYDPLSFSVGCHIGPKGYGMGISVCRKIMINNLLFNSSSWLTPVHKINLVSCFGL